MQRRRRTTIKATDVLSLKGIKEASEPHHCVKFTFTTSILNVHVEKAEGVAIQQ